MVRIGSVLLLPEAVQVRTRGPPSAEAPWTSRPCGWRLPSAHATACAAGAARTIPEIDVVYLPDLPDHDQTRLTPCTGAPYGRGVVPREWAGVADHGSSSWAGGGRRAPARPVLALALGLLLVTGAVAPAVSAPAVDDERVAEVTAYLESEREELGIPGLAAVLVADGEAVLEVGLGTADEAGTPVTPQTPFLIASLSKSVTAVAVLQLVDEGLVDLDEPVTTYLPELAPGGDEVTVTDLMHHRAGVPRRTDGEAFVGRRASSLELNVARVADDLHPAGFEYSNSSYDVLALLVERVAGTSFEAYLREHVFGPLGMHGSTTDPAVAEVAGLATGHDHWLLLGYRPHEPRMPDGLVGSYRMFSTAHDLGFYLDAQLGARSTVNDPVISDAARAVLHTGEPTTGAALYGGGLYVFPADAEAAERNPLRARTILAHDGRAVGYGAELWLWPEEQVGFAVLANANDQADEQQLTRVAANVQRLLLDVPVVPDGPPADPLYRWGKQALALLVVAQLLASLAVVPALVRRRGGAPSRRGRVALAVALALDLVAVVATVVLLPRALEWPLRAILNVPDMRLMILTALVVAALGAVLLALWVLPSAKRPSTPVTPG